MRFPRNIKIFRGQLDAAPFASVTFLLVLFVILQSKLVFNPGVRIDLPEVPADLPGTWHPTVVVAVDRSGLIYYQGQLTSLEDLRNRLRVVLDNAGEPMTLEVQADRAATLESTAPLMALAAEFGISEALLVTRPRIEPIVNGGGK